MWERLLNRQHCFWAVPKTPWRNGCVFDKHLATLYQLSPVSARMITSSVSQVGQRTAPVAAGPLQLRPVGQLTVPRVPGRAREPTVTRPPPHALVMLIIYEPEICAYFTPSDDPVLTLHFTSMRDTTIAMVRSS